MRVILLLSVNFVRTQWIIIVVMLAYVAGINGFLAWNVQPGEILVFLRIQGLYAISFVLLTAVPAIHSERKSRRILVVLSKGIERWRYLGGILCGCAMISGIFCVMVGLAAALSGSRTNSSVTGLTAFLIMLFAASVCAASIGMFCSTFLHPMFATGLASALVALPALGMMRGWNLPPVLFPVGEAVRRISDFKFQKADAGVWIVVVAALAQALMFWMAGAIMFARRDVTTASE